MNPSRIWLAREIEAFAHSLPQNAVVLDAGAGKQTYAPMFSGMVYESADFEKVDKTYGDSTYVCDLANIPAENERYDAVLFTQVMEHLPDPLGALRKIRDLLKPGGVGVLEFPNIDAFDARLRRWLDRWHVHRHHYAPTYVPGHVQEFCRASFAFAAERAGLALEVWETYAINPVKYLLFRHVPIGNKARVLVRRPR